jgi:preprotein translocase subunit YajC
MEFFQQYGFLIAMVVVMYFFILQPQIRRQKQEKKFGEELKKGDKVVTKSGMHGKVMEINEKDQTCVLETMAGKLRFDKSAISMELSSKLNKPADKTGK